MDYDADGYITLSDIKSFVQHNGVPLNKDDQVAMFKQLLYDDSRSSSNEGSSSTSMMMLMMTVAYLVL